MPTELYLDTARFGRTRRRAWHAQRDFLRLCAEEAGSAHLEVLLRDGHESWPDRLRARYPALADWRGVAGMKGAVRRLVGAPAGSEVLLAQRSAVLMRLAARALSRRCRRVLHTDLEWPGYLEILQAERAGEGVETVCLPVRSALLSDRASPAELLELVAQQYRARACDGLFLSAVSYEGIRFPVAELLRVLPPDERPRLVVVDGAQALGHAPFDPGVCDIFLAGCHKWLRSGHPLGLAVLPAGRSRAPIRGLCDELRRAGELDDPLLGFAGQLERDEWEAFGETVDLAGLFAAAAAVGDALADRDGPDRRFSARMASGRGLADAAAAVGWDPLEPAPPLRSGIRLLRPGPGRDRSTPPERWRAAFQGRGIAVTTYREGIVRVSAPSASWEDGELDLVCAALRHCS
jgi:hypothetical protein